MITKLCSAVQSLPPKITYFPDFITDDEETKLLEKVYTAPKPKWTQLSNRRLQNWGGLPHPKGMIQEPIPNWLELYMGKIASLDVFGEVQPNHCLVNEYLPGQGIMPHEDGPLFYPTVSTISLGSHTILNFYTRLGDEGPSDQAAENQMTSWTERLVGSLLLERRSLVLVQEDMYTSYLHGISETKEDFISNINNIDLVTQHKEGETVERGTRVSLTIRHVPKTVSSDRFSGLFGKKKN